MEIVLELVVVACAVVGAALGVYNFVHARKQERVQLRVTPKATYQLGQDAAGRIGFKSSTDDLIDGQIPDLLGLEIVNLSSEL